MNKIKLLIFPCFLIMFSSCDQSKGDDNKAMMELDKAPEGKFVTIITSEKEEIKLEEPGYYDDDTQSIRMLMDDGTDQEDGFIKYEKTSGEETLKFPEEVNPKLKLNKK